MAFLGVLEVPRIVAAEAIAALLDMDVTSTARHACAMKAYEALMELSPYLAFELEDVVRDALESVKRRLVS